MIATDHQAACHYAEEALKSDVGVARVPEEQARHGTPAAVTARVAADAKMAADAREADAAETARAAAANESAVAAPMAATDESTPAPDGDGDRGA
jgi:hypothetical protein